MNIKEFYEANGRRQSSPEFSYGLDWKDATDPDHVFDVFWVQDTGELYTMRKDAPSLWPPLVDQQEVAALRNELQEYEVGVKELLSGLFHPLHRSAKQPYAPSAVSESDGDDTADSLQVEVLALLRSHEEIETVLQGWQEASSTPDSLTWLRQRISEERIS